MIDLEGIEDVETLRTWLAEAMVAEHKLVMGEKVTSLSYVAEGQNQRVYNQVSLTLEPLRLHIMQLREKIARVTGGRARRRLFHI